MSNINKKLIIFIYSHFDYFEAVKYQINVEIIS